MTQLLKISLLHHHAWYLVLTTTINICSSRRVCPVFSINGCCHVIYIVQRPIFLLPLWPSNYRLTLIPKNLFDHRCNCIAWILVNPFFTCDSPLPLAANIIMIIVLLVIYIATEVHELPSRFQNVHGLGQGIIALGVTATVTFR